MSIAKELLARAVMGGHKVPILAKFLAEYDDQDMKARAAMAGIGEKEVPTAEFLFECVVAWPKNVPLIHSLFGSIGRISGKPYCPTVSDIRQYRDLYGARREYLREVSSSD